MATNLAISGLASGFDWQTLIDKLVDVERTPQRLLRTQQTTLQKQASALDSLKTELTALQERIKALSDPTLFDSRTAASSSATLASATASSGATAGTYSFNVTRLASAAVLQGAQNISLPLNDSDDVSGLVLSSARFATAVTEGHITVNGTRIQVASTDTLQTVLGGIAAAIGGTASYSAATDTITLDSPNEIVLGSATDTSNFLQAARLNNTGLPGAVVSSAKLGALSATGPLTQPNLAIPISDGGGGAGLFRINGVDISFNASTDTIANVLTRINDSDAGVIARYDSINNRFSLTNKGTGDVGFAVEDVTGNFIQATGLAGASLVHGSDLVYTLNNGPQLTSRSNTISEDSSGLVGVSVTALAKGTFDVTVGSDTSKMKTAITDFINQYNKVQGLIKTQTASTTDANGKVTAGVLAGDQDVSRVSSDLRNLLTSTVSGLDGTLQRLDSLGINSNGYDDNLSTANLSSLDDALATNLSGVKDLFAHVNTGLAARLNAFLDRTIGESGSLISHHTNLTTQSKGIDKQVESLERQVLAYQQQLTNSFIAMETAQARINEQLTYLQRTFFGSS